MRVTLIVLAIAALLTGGAAFVLSGSASAGAQAAATEPLLYNEIASWCPATDVPNEHACDRATFETEADGTVRVVLNDLGGLSRSTTSCVKGFTFTDAVNGSAYVVNNDNSDFGFHIPLTEVKPEYYVCEFLIRRIS